MKLTPYPIAGVTDAFQVDSSFFIVHDDHGNETCCHIERIAPGIWRLNPAGFLNHENCIGPEFATPEEAAVWGAMNYKLVK